MTERRERRSYDENFKKQLVQLLNNGKPRSEIISENTGITARNVMKHIFQTCWTVDSMNRLQWLLLSVI